MKKSVKIFVFIILFLIIGGITAISVTGDGLQGIMRKLNLDPSILKRVTPICTETDQGLNYLLQGTTTGLDEKTKVNGTYADSCSNSVGTEGLTEGEWIAEKHCSTKGNYVHTQWYKCPDGCSNGQCISDYLIYTTTNEDQSIPETNSLRTEIPGIIKAVEKDNIIVLIPEGYEELAKSHVEDLINCRPLLSNFLGIDFPASKIKSKIFISSDNSNLSFTNDTIIFYKRSQENIDFDLQDVLENSPEGFLYQSSSSYCANTHELTHAFLAGAPLPRWANEGFAEYSQSINQPGSKDGTDCEENGFSTTDSWEDGEYKFFPFSDLSQPAGTALGDEAKWYRTAMCFTKEIYTTYGRNSFLDLIQKLRQYSENLSLLANDSLAYNDVCRAGTSECVFINKVLIEILGSSVQDILEKYGFQQEDYSI